MCRVVSWCLQKMGVFIVQRSWKKLICFETKVKSQGGETRELCSVPHWKNVAK